jgi:hypothetical protein
MSEAKEAFDNACAAVDVLTGELLKADAARNAAYDACYGAPGEPRVEPTPERLAAYHKADEHFHNVDWMRQAAKLIEEKARTKLIVTKG